MCVCIHVCLLSHFIPLGWPWEAQSSPRVARESWGWRSSHCSPAEPPAEVLGNGASRLVPPQQGQWEEDPEGLLPNPPWRPHLTPQAVTSLRGPAGKRIRHPSEFPSCGYYYPQFSSEFGTGALWPAAAAPGSADQRQPPTVPPPSPQPYPHSPFQSMWIHQVDSSSTQPLQTPGLQLPKKLRALWIVFIPLGA